MESVESLVILISSLLLASILAAKLSGKLGIPALLFFLAIGMLAGSDGPGRIAFDQPKTVQFFGIIALIFILFSGGLDTVWRTSKRIAVRGFALSTFGVMLTTALVGVFASWVLGLSRLEGLLLGAAVSSTDATAVFTILRSQNISLRGPLKPLLELESGSNDPMAVFLTIGILKLIQHPELSPFSLIPAFIGQMTIGAFIGAVAGNGMVFLMNYSRLGFEGLYSVLSVGIVLLSFGISQILGGNGFLAVYLAGIIAGNSNFAHKRSLTQFQEGLAWLMQIAMFFILGLQVSPKDLLSVAIPGFLLSIFLMFFARPISVYLTLIGSQFNFRERTLISWVGLRGAAPIILATYPLLSGLPHAQVLFNWVFFIAITSILFQGTSVVKVSQWLKLEDHSTVKPPFPIEIHSSSHLSGEVLEFEVSPYSEGANQPILSLKLPKKAQIVLIQRSTETFAPTGSTQLKAGDRLMMIADQTQADSLRTLFEGPRKNSA